MNAWLALVLALLAATPAAAEPVSWAAATEYPASAMPGEGLADFAARVDAATAGRVHLVPRFEGPDGLRSATIPGAVQSGRLAVGDAFAGALEPLDPVFGLSSLPFVATDAAAAHALADRARPFYAAAFARMGQTLLYVTPWPPTGLWSRAAVPDAAALQGLAVRSYDAGSTAVLRRAGARPEQISFADAGPRLADGSLAAVLSSGDGGAGRKLWDVLPHFTAIGYAMPLSFATVNTAALDALVPADRQAVQAAAAATEARQWERLADREERNRRAMLDHGMQLDPASPSLDAALRNAARATVAAWKEAAPDAAGLVP